MEEAALVFIVLFIVFFGFIALMRWINYKETLYLAEKGLTKPIQKANGSGRGYLIWGILIAALGLAILLGTIPAIAIHSYLVVDQPILLAGLIPLFIGLGLVLIYYLLFAVKKESDDKPELPPGKDLSKDK